MPRTWPLILLFFSLFGKVQAQEPGILGRRLMIGVDATLAPPTGNSLYRRDFSADRRTPLLGTALRLGYVLNRNTMLDVHLIPGAASFYNFDQRLYTREKSLIVAAAIRNCSFFRSGNLAPIGYFAEYGAALQGYQIGTYGQLPVEGASPDSTRLRLAGYLVFHAGRTWVRGRMWGEFSFQAMGNLNSLSSFNETNRSRVARLHAATIRVCLGIMP